MPDNSAAVAQLESLLASGLRSHTVDGQTTVYMSRDEMIAELTRLKREDTVNGYQKRRAIRSVNLGGF
jgi:hypothetical protein